MKDENRILDLDELFGQAQVIAVMWGGRKHFMRRPEEMGPRDVVAFDRLNAQLYEMRKFSPFPDGDGAETAIDEKRATAWESVLDAMLRVVGPTLLEGDPPLPFAMKTRVLEFYTQQIQPTTTASEDEKKVPIGETSLSS